MIPPGVAIGVETVISREQSVRAIRPLHASWYYVIFTYRTYDKLSLVLVSMRRWHTCIFPSLRRRMVDASYMDQTISSIIITHARLLLLLSVAHWGYWQELTSTSATNIDQRQPLYPRFVQLAIVITPNTV